MSQLRINHPAWDVKQNGWMPNIYSPMTHKYAWVIEELLQSAVKERLEEKRISWIGMGFTNKLRILATRLRGEKWIRKIWRHSTCNFKDLEGNEKNWWIYCLFNAESKKIYIGSTKGTLMKRYSQHWRDYNFNTQRRCYQYMRNLGDFQKWMIIPLEKVQKQDKRIEITEKQWIHKFRGQLINDPLIWDCKPIRAEEKSYLDTRESKKRRVEARKTIKVNYRKSANLVCNTNLWKEWSNTAMVKLLCHLKIAQLETIQQRKVNGILRNHLKKTMNIKLLEKYTCKLLTTKELNRKRIKSWIYHRILKIAPLAIFAKYVALHLEVIGTAEKTLGSMIGNKKRVIMQQKGKPTCKCHEIDMPKIDGHIHTKAINLGDNFKDLRDILVISKKNPVWYDEKAYFGKQFAMLRLFFKKINLDDNWSPGENQEIFEALRRRNEPQLDKRLVKDRVAALMKPWKDSLTFVEIDKNANTWAIICQQRYLEEMEKHFSDQTHYEEIREMKNTIKKQIEGSYSNKNLQKKIKGKTKWELGSGSLLPKNKDIKKFRPLVSYSKFYTRTFGKLASRALTVLIRYLKGTWKTMELMRTKDTVGELSKLNAGKKWKEVLEKGKLTFLKFDIKNQFTNLPKAKVLEALQAAIKVVMKKSGKKHIALRRREEERHSDKLGTGTNRTWINIGMDELMQYTRLELHTPYIQVGGKIYRQIEGLPMGGYLSAGLAVIYSMWKENCYSRAWRNLEMKSKWLRFRDDILVILEGEVTPVKTKQLQEILQEVYGKELTVELEDTSNDAIHFLDYNIWKTTGGLRVWNHNKNYGIILPAKKELATIRFPEMSSETERTVMKGIVNGTVKKVLKAANFQGGRILGILEACLEFGQKGYPRRWILDALKGTSEEMKMLRKVTNEMMRTRITGERKYVEKGHHDNG